MSACVPTFTRTSFICINDWIASLCRKGPTTNLPVKISGGARNTFTAEFSPREVGSHTISVDYNGMPVTGTPFVCKVYDAKNVYVSPMPAGVLRKNLQFTGNDLQYDNG